jgi:hypothetical protein
MNEGKLGSRSALVIYTAIAPRWIAILGYVLACVLLIGSYYISSSFFVLPLWVLLISILSCWIIWADSRKFRPPRPNRWPWCA